MNKINSKYRINKELSPYIKQLLTDAKLYAEVGDPDMFGSLDESLEDRPNLSNLEKKLKEAKKLSLKLDKSSQNNIKKQIEKIKNLYWGLKEETGPYGCTSVSLDLSRAHPKTLEAYSEIDYRFRKQVSKRIEEGRRGEIEAERELKKEGLF